MNDESVIEILMGFSTPRVIYLRLSPRGIICIHHPYALFTYTRSLSLPVMKCLDVGKKINVVEVRLINTWFFAR
jgi:hypothetical protein